MSAGMGSWLVLTFCVR